MYLSISRDFSETPGGRYRDEGNHSGQEFLEDILDKKYIEAKEKGDKLTIDFDGGYGYPTSFLEAAFGGLARKYGEKEVLSTLDFISNDEPPLIEEVRGYILEANQKR